MWLKSEYIFVFRLQPDGQNGFLLSLPFSKYRLIAMNMIVKTGIMQDVTFQKSRKPKIDTYYLESSNTVNLMIIQNENAG